VTGPGSQRTLVLSLAAIMIVVLAASIRFGAIDFSVGDIFDGF
jgi:hypothetical protein